MSRPAFRAVLFDLDDTLHDDTAAYQGAARSVAEDVARSHAVDASRLLAAYIRQAESFWKNLSAEQLLKPIAGTRSALWNSALNEIGLRDAALAETCAASYNRYRKNFLKLWPGALELLGALRRRGCRLGLVTNGFAETHREKIVLLELENAFDEVFIADEVGMLKPDPRIFALACRSLGATPEASAMVGDRYERDVRGAHAAGLFAVWLNVRGEDVPAGAPPPDVTVTGLGDVEAALFG